MDDLVVFAQGAYNERQEEINALKDLLEGALEKSILESKRWRFDTFIDVA